jgi:deoxyadenosine/deoxycytidine kinase
VPRPPFIVITGNIGAGKTTFASALGQRLAIPVYREPFEDNPFLERAYADPVSWRGKSARWFLEAAADIHRNAADTGGIQDRGVHENYEVFTSVHRQLGWIDDACGHDLDRLAAELYFTLPAIDLLIYLRVPPAMCAERIIARGRGMEAGVDLELLSAIGHKLEQMTGDWPYSPLLIIEPFSYDTLDRQLDRVTRTLAEQSQL